MQAITPVFQRHFASAVKSGTPDPGQPVVPARCRTLLRLAILLLTVTVGYQAKAEESEFSASRTVIVVSDKAEAFAGNEAV